MGRGCQRLGHPAWRKFPQAFGIGEAVYIGGTLYVSIYMYVRVRVPGRARAWIRGVGSLRSPDRDDARGEGGGNHLGGPGYRPVVWNASGASREHISESDVPGERPWLGARAPNGHMGHRERSA